MLTRKDEEALEAQIDKSSLHDVLHSLIAICYAKAEHIETNWQDTALAGQWGRAASILETTAKKVRGI